MTEQSKKLAIVASRGLDDERSTVAWTIANGGLDSGLDVTMFLVSSAVDLVRKQKRRSFWGLREQRFS